MQQLRVRKSHKAGHLLLYALLLKQGCWTGFVSQHGFGWAVEDLKVAGTGQAISRAYLRVQRVQVGPRPAPTSGCQKRRRSQTTPPTAQLQYRGNRSTTVKHSCQFAHVVLQMCVRSLLQTALKLSQSHHLQGYGTMLSAVAPCAS